MHEFKYSSKIYLADLFADIIIENFPYKLSEIDVIVAVPLHINRLRSRWYNQSVLVCRVLAKKTGLALDMYSLKKVRDTGPQINMQNFKKRAAKVKDSFDVSVDKAFSEKTVLLLDDVYTSAPTINECARQLLGSGAKQVLALTIARAV